MKFLGQNLYQHGDTFHYRFTINDVRTTRKLAAIIITDARKEGRAKQSAHNRSKMGLCPDPFAPKPEECTVAKLAEEYAKAGYPDRKMRPREKNLRDIARHVTCLATFFGSQDATSLAPADCDRYHAHRTSQCETGKGGHSTVDSELVTLNNLLTWSVRKEKLKYNPLLGRTPRYVRRQDVRNCNSVMPANDEELNLIANTLFSDPQSEVLGWQLLLEAMTGCRTSEVLALRWDAKIVNTVQCQPGVIDATVLWLNRLKSGICPWALLEAAPAKGEHPAVAPLRDLLPALRHWHAQRYPKSPWYLPGVDPTQHVGPGSLTHALARICKSLGLPHRTSHGLRAYFVRVLRGLGIDDAEIAKRLGQRSGPVLVQTVYGLTEPGWFGTRQLDWLPSEASKITPAWRQWLPETKPNIIPMAKTA